jgi:multiple sugar transport system ATP-binding protein
LAIRPEHLEINREAGRTPGTISHVEHLGGETNVYVKTNHHGLLTVRRFGQHPYGVDETVQLTPDPARVFHFADDGCRWQHRATCVPSASDASAALKPSCRFLDLFT